MTEIAGDIFGHGAVSWMPFVNNSGSQMSQHSAIKLTGIESVENQWYLSATQPDSAANILVAFVDSTNVTAGTKGMCLPMSRTAFAKYDNANTPANGEIWGVDNGSFLIKKNFGSQWMVVGADTTNEVAMVMDISGAHLLAKNDGAVTAGNTGTFSIYTGTLGSETDTGDNVTAEVRGEDVDSGLWHNLVPRGDGWEAYPLECNA